MALRLDEWRRARNISQEDMAKYCEVHVNTYRHWEEHPERIKLHMAKKIAERLEVSMEEIVF